MNAADNLQLVPYTTLDYVKRNAFQSRPKDDWLQQDKIIAASRLFDTLCDREEGSFRQALPQADIREFRGNGTNYLQLPPYVRRSIVDTRYRNGGLLPEFIESPRSFILAFPDCFFLRNCDVVEITARWGYELIPPDIEEAVSELVVAMWRQRDAAYLRVVAESNSGIPGISGQALPERTRAIINAYRRPVIVT